MSRFATKEELISQASNIKADLTASENKMLEKLMEVTKNFYNVKVDKWKQLIFLVFAGISFGYTGYSSLRTEIKEVRAETKEIRVELGANTKQLADFQAEMRAALSEIKKSQNAK